MGVVVRPVKKSTVQQLGRLILLFAVRSAMNLPLRQMKKLVILVLGGSVLLVGVIMIISPGPAFIVIPAGLAILAVEFEWARRLLKKARNFYAAQAEAWRQKKLNGQREQ